jgi:hypothetical protein
MRGKADAVRQSIAALLRTDMEGQLHDGDELGLWTFNNELHTGEFPLVKWNTTARDSIVQGVEAFLEKQRFGKSSDFSKVMPHLMEVVKSSKRITVILFSDGDEVIEGTPFDEALARSLREHANLLKGKSVPILTVLRGYEGRLIGHTISNPPWPVEFPEFPPEQPPEPVAVEVAPEPRQPDLARTVVTTNKGPIVFAEPLIVSGSGRKAERPSAKEVGSVSPGAVAESATNSGAGRPEPVPPPEVAPASAGKAIPEVVSPTPQMSMEGEPPLNPTGDRPGFWTPVRMLGALFVLGCIGGAGLLLRKRASRRASTSLITQSMDGRD